MIGSGLGVALFVSYTLTLEHFLGQMACYPLTFFPIVTGSPPDGKRERGVLYRVWRSSKTGACCAVHECTVNRNCCCVRHRGIYFTDQAQMGGGRAFPEPYLPSTRIFSAASMKLAEKSTPITCRQYHGEQATDRNKDNANG